MTSAASKTSSAVPSATLVPSENALTRVISRVRRLSELDDGRSFTLETITRVGYGLKRTTGSAITPVAAVNDGGSPIDPRRAHVAGAAHAGYDSAQPENLEGSRWGG